MLLLLYQSGGFKELDKYPEKKVQRIYLHILRDNPPALGVHSASNQHDERRYEFYWGCKSHVLANCISGLPLYELTTPANTADSTVVLQILTAADNTFPLQECTFLGDKGYDAKLSITR